VNKTELAIVRRAYAKQVLGASHVSDAAIEAAFAAVPREDFLGPGPWQILRWMTRPGYVPTPDDDPVHLYTNDLVAIVPERLLNNGQPSLHAHLINQASPKPGEHVVHIGTGLGYYTAIMAHLVGANGRTTGVEFDHDLAVRARANFTGSRNVEIIEGDGALVPFKPADVIYVNAGATRPANVWLDRLADCGRMILPLTIDKAFSPDFATITPGAVFRIERKGDDYFARMVSSVAIFPCAGNREQESERALAAALEKKGIEKVTRLYRHNDVPEDQCWLVGPGWCLAYS
jgi:protein-L-isoaspartate(D-aspartate) O-methyltransferase